MPYAIIIVDSVINTVSLNQSLDINVILSPSRTQQPLGGTSNMLIQGTHAVINITVFSDADTAYDLEDCTINMLIVTPDTKTSILVPITILNRHDGKAAAYLSPEQLPEGGTYKMQVIVTFPDDTTSKSAIGAFYVADSLTPPGVLHG